MAPVTPDCPAAEATGGGRAQDAAGSPVLPPRGSVAPVAEPRKPRPGPALGTPGRGTPTPAAAELALSTAAAGPDVPGSGPSLDGDPGTIPGTGEADPATASRLPASPGRGTTRAPAGAGRRRAAGAVPAGSTGALFIDVQDTERATLERAKRADSKAFLNAHLAGKMSEAELEEQIRDACKKLGIIRFHVRVSIGTTPGLPDDILIGPRGILWRECKTRKGKLTAAQVSVGEALRAAGQDWGVWRPEDWFSGRIARELAALAGPGAA